MLQVFRYVCSVFLSDQLSSMALKTVTKKYQKVVYALLLALAGTFLFLHFQQSIQPNFYKDLGIKRMFSDTELKKAYREKSLKYHPDKKGGSVELFKKYQAEYDILRNPETREIYDKLGESTARMFHENKNNYTMAHANGMIQNVLYMDGMSYLFEAFLLRALSSNDILIPARKAYQLIILPIFAFEIFMMYPQGLQLDLVDSIFPQALIYERLQIFRVLAAFLCIAIKLAFQIKGSKRTQQVIDGLNSANNQLSEIVKTIDLNGATHEKHQPLQAQISNVLKTTSDIATICTSRDFKYKKANREKLRKKLRVALVGLIVVCVILLVVEKISFYVPPKQTETQGANFTQST